MRFVRRGWNDPKNKEGWTAANAVYIATRLYSKLEYVGDTGMTLMKRVIAHVRKTIGGKTRQKVYKFFGRMNIHSFIWTPIWAWSGATTRRTRMRKEGEYIYVRGARMNSLGTENHEDRQGATGMTIMGRRRRFRCAMRLRELHKCGLRMTVQHSNNSLCSSDQYCSCTNLDN